MTTPFKPNIAQDSFKACGEACGMQRHETILGSVLRTVEERDAWAETAASQVTEIKRLKEKIEAMELHKHVERTTILKGIEEIPEVLTRMTYER